MIFTPAISETTFINAHDKSTSTLQLSKGKLNDLQKLLRDFSKIYISTLTFGTASYASWSASPRFPGCGSLFGVFPVMFALYLSDLVFNILPSFLFTSSLQ